MMNNTIRKNMVNGMEKEKVNTMENGERFYYLFNALMENHQSEYAIVPYVATIGKQFRHGTMYIAIVPIKKLIKGFVWYDNSTDNLRSFRKNLHFNKFVDKYAVDLFNTGITLDEFEALYAMRKARGMKSNKGQFFESFVRFVLTIYGFTVYQPNIDLWYQSADLYIEKYGLLSVKYYDNTLCHGVTVDRLNKGIAWYEPQLDIKYHKTIVTQAVKDRFDTDIEAIRK